MSSARLIVLLREQRARRCPAVAEVDAAELASRPGVVSTLPAA